MLYGSVERYSASVAPHLDIEPEPRTGAESHERDKAETTDTTAQQVVEPRSRYGKALGRVGSWDAPRLDLLPQRVRDPGP